MSSARHRAGSSEVATSGRTLYGSSRSKASRVMSSARTNVSTPISSPWSSAGYMAHRGELSPSCSVRVTGLPVATATNSSMASPRRTSMPHTS
jgi:hypothetical protein